ncbi:MAG: serine/threonine protein kinase [Deltaproteobacteria bacterium]|nr:serine/threonine protein kinase [Deltaproteobacteria bacterium]
MSIAPEPTYSRFGTYVLLDRISVGGMAEVFRARQMGVEGFSKMVAIKRILPNIAQDEEFIEMFVDEAKLTVQMEHGNVVKIFDLGKVDTSYYIAMEYISGVDLRTVWDRARKRQRLLPIAMSCFIMQKVCEGLDYAHRKKGEDGTEYNLVHRDVSPQNVLVSYEGEVKVVDFGIAKASHKVGKTQAGVLKGKFGYMSPEQVRGHELDNRSDIFACGVLLWELLVGDRLFLGESDFSTLEKVRKVELVPPTQLNKRLSPQVERIVMKALAKSREDRYRWASEMAEDLQRYLFASNQPFARTDLQRYMKQHFAEELDAEQQRLDRYRQLDLTKYFSPKPEQKSKSSEFPAPVIPFPSPPIAPVLPLTSDTQNAHQGPAAHSGALPTWVKATIGGLAGLFVVTAGVGLFVFLKTRDPDPGTLNLDVVPETAEIRVDGKVVSNKAPYQASLPPGTYEISASSEGYAPMKKSITIAEGVSLVESFALERRLANASMLVRSRPEGLEIWLDGKRTGDRTPATLLGLLPGKHQVELQDEGDVLHRGEIDLVSNVVGTVDVDVTSLPPTLEIMSSPLGATVSVDGSIVGLTPMRLQMLAAGRVKVRVEGEGCGAAEKEVELSAGRRQKVDLELTCPPGTKITPGPLPTGKLSVSAPVIADVFVDGQKIGATPLLGNVVPVGEHEIRIVPIQPGRNSQTLRVLIAKDKPVQIEAKL